MLFLLQKWWDSRPELGIMRNDHYWWGALEGSGLATQERFHLDEYYHLHHRAGDAELLAHCMRSMPDLLYLGWVPNAPRVQRYCNPKLETLNIIRKKMGIPIVAFWGDTGEPFSMQLADSVSPIASLNVVLDSMVYLKTSLHPEMYLPLWSPLDPRVFYDPQLERDIDISFVGTIGEKYPLDRHAGIAALRSNNLEVHQAGARHGEESLPIEEYARILMRSKITLNFCTMGHGRYKQVKGRVFEAIACGAMLLEGENEETSEWLEPMVDYVPFADEADLVEKAKYYLEHDLERVEIAARGHQKAIERYTGERFWRTIFSEVFDPRLSERFSELTSWHRDGQGTNGF